MKEALRLGNGRAAFALSIAVALSACAGAERSSDFASESPFGPGKGEFADPVWRYDATNGVRVVALLPGFYGASEVGFDNQALICAFVEAVENGPITLVYPRDLKPEDGSVAYTFKRQDPGHEVPIDPLVVDEAEPVTVEELGENCPS